MEKTYNNDEYESMLRIIINDAFYVDGMSYDAKIGQIRKYAEIILRRMLDYPIDKPLTLGRKQVKKELYTKGFTEPLFIDAIQNINSLGNASVHAQKTRPADEDDYNKALDSLFNLYGYMFYKYFKKYPFGSNNRILTAFSILPPIIRHITLNELYKDEPENGTIINKLVLAKVKAFDKDTAIEWIESNKENLIKHSGNMGWNLYEENMDIANKVGDCLISRGILYKDYEEALKYYKEYGIVPGDSEKINEFNSLMEFVYIGRKEK